MNFLMIISLYLYNPKIIQKGMITMLSGMTIIEIIKLFLPLIVLEFGLKIFCFFKLYNDKVKFFPKYIWLVIILLINTIGPLAYLIIGRKRD
jgi:hypothetical protein